MFSKQKNKKYVDVLNKYLPPHELSLNVADGKNKKTYVREFFKHYVEFFVPYMMRKSEQNGQSLQDCNILDIGCGGGPFAAAFLLLRTATNGSGTYTGIDIRTDLIDCLYGKYKEHSFINFKKNIVSTDRDYIHACDKNGTTLPQSDGKEGDVDVEEDFYDLQWSNSVFTHLTPTAGLTMLKKIAVASKKSAIQLNTWLVIDDESKYALAAGLTDRSLPIDMGEYLTYSESNPLVCTAYKQQFVYEMYDKAGLEILSIEKGSWRGLGHKNDANNYIDIIMSRKK